MAAATPFLTSKDILAPTEAQKQNEITQASEINSGAILYYREFPLQIGESPVLATLRVENCFALVNPLTASDALPNYPSHAEAVNTITLVKRLVSVLVILEPYSCLNGCYVFKLPGGTSHRAIWQATRLVLQPWGPCFGIWVCLFLARESTKLEIKVQY